MRNRFIWLGLMALILLLSACNTLPIETEMAEEVADFSFTTQDNEPFGLDDLQGDFWIADFIFTNCETVCLPMTSNMAKLQKEMEDNDVSIPLVSFTVDPEFDQPKVLKSYGEQYGANFDTWHFLTGYEQKTIKTLSIKSFRALLKEPGYGSDQFTHDIRFFLVNPDGEVIKGYDGTKNDSIQDILDDLATLKEHDLL